MSEPASMTQAMTAAHLQKAGLRVTDNELDEVMSFYSSELVDVLFGVAEARYEVPALGFDPGRSLTGW